MANSSFGKNSAFSTPLPWRVSKILLVSVGLTLFQLALSFFVNGGSWNRLTNWDAAWYRQIADFGYVVKLPFESMPDGKSNLAFFPGFPLWAKLLMKTFELSSLQAVPLAAQLAYAGFWVYFFLLLKRLEISVGAALGVAFFFICQPGAFYLITGYSEAFFCFLILGFVFWTTRFMEEKKPSPAVFALAVLHGGVMTATRFLGFPLVIFPFILLWTHRRKIKLSADSLSRAAAISLFSLSGIVAFFLYIRSMWGRWDLYFDACRVGWQVSTDYFKLLSWAYYRDVFFFGNLPEMVGRVTAFVSLGVLGRWVWNDYRKPGKSPLSTALALLSLYFLIETMVASHGMHSMSRHILPIHAVGFLVLARKLQDALDEEGLLSFATPKRIAIALILIILLTTIEANFIGRYSVSAWVA